MQKIAKFEKVSLAQFKKDWSAHFTCSEEEMEKIYDRIQLPKRATTGSAGYDFETPVSFSLKPGEVILIPTGIRAKMADGYVLMMFPRSGLGFKFRMQLNNTVGIIDADYYHADNEGHIMCKITNDTHEDKTLSLEAGKGMVQGIFVPFGITEDDEADGVRTGGFGSTSKE
jgi:dUTP pyrophosphatase